jgi:RNA polymerase sigma-70 factor (ECF subfamily)
VSATDEQLVIAVQAGDTDSLGTLMLRWEQPLFRFVYRMLLRREDARDVCQETFLRVLDKADRFKSGSRFSTWMYQIALNLCRDQLRRRRRWSLLMAENHEFDEALTPAPRESSIGGDPSREVEQHEQSAAVARALGQIPPEQREVLLLKEYEGLKFREIAEILRCPESTVKSRMYYGLSGLRAALLRDGYTGARARPEGVDT